MIELQQSSENWNVLRDGKIVKENLIMSEAKKLRDFLQLQEKNKVKLQKIVDKVNDIRSKMNK